MRTNIIRIAHSLNVLCNGNKSKLARKMGFRRPDVNRMLKRLNEGANSLRAAEAALEFIHQEGCSLDGILAGYKKNKGAPKEVRRACEDVRQILREQMANRYLAPRMKMRILQSATAFMEQLERAFCSDYCRIRRSCVSECPCKQFVEFIVSIQEEMEGVSTSGDMPNQHDLHSTLP